MKKKEIYYHIAGWLLYIVYLLTGEFLGFSHIKAPLFSYTLVFAQMVAFYVCYFWVNVNKGKVSRIVIGGIAGLLGFVIVRYLVEEVVIRQIFQVSAYTSSATILDYIFNSLYRGLPAVMLSIAVYGMFNALHKGEENKLLREEKMRTEKALLKTNINPGFLYDTLDYMYSLAYPISDKLGDAAKKLLQLMRYAFTESTAEEVDLLKEIEFIQTYIFIHQLRFEEGFYVNFKAEGDLADKRIATLLLIAFVENAMQQGVTDNPVRPVRIQLKVTGSRLVFSVSYNQGKPSTGDNLHNIRRRLELIYPGRHELLIGGNGQTYKTTLNIML
ncbi:histidine kinase [Mucilaginibacter sp. Bleaf8]|uniref:sensor histidine kinase n=1 Tax=Mucilaginibacter sp. Bleaf8 TaxID=2834430 RepID=UPI001BCC620C|nr:histidine kinase [Mucilaginibacter sp. Bleaf8]MBS7566546.1 histidine kinase [Mucilaginibacter sp. Bleaf8]